MYGGDIKDIVGKLRLFQQYTVCMVSGHYSVSDIVDKKECNF